LIHADDSAIGLLNGTKIFPHAVQVTSANFTDPPETFTATSPFVGGTNTFAVDLFNQNAAPPNPSATDFCFTVSYSTCPAAPAVANALLAEHGYKANSGTAKYIISLVANHMTQGAKFDGLAPCDAGYAAAVAAFVDLYLP
jgi:hypothetical protein